jgi:ABC-type transporter Mla MlaB component
MLKISKTGTPNHSVTLKPWVVELRRICEPLLREQSQLNLDLADVSYVDGDGVATLTDFQSRGVRLNDCSPFVEQQIKAATRCRSETMEPPR